MSLCPARGGRRWPRSTCCLARRRWRSASTSAPCPAWLAVATGEPGERDGHSRLLGDLADHRLGGGLADLKASSGQLPVAVIDPADQKDLPATLRTAANAAGSTSCARGAFGSR